MNEQLNRAGQASDSKPAGLGVPSARAEISLILRWVQDHSVLLAAAAIVLPGVSLFHYSQHEHVPLSLTSPDLLAGLPLLLSMISFVTVILGAAFLAPLSVMFDSAKREASGRLRLFPKHKGQRRKQLLRWLFALAVPGLVIATALYCSTFLRDRAGGTAIQIALCISAAAFIILTHFFIGRGSLRQLVTDTLPVAFVSAFCQMLLSTLVMQASLSFLAPDASNPIIFLVLIGTVVGLSFLQIFCAALIETTSSLAGSITHACAGAAVVIALACLFPPTGAKLAGTALSLSASGGQSCVQFRLGTDSGELDFLKLPEPKGQEALENKTIGLRILAAVDGGYLVRIAKDDSQDVYRIPKDRVISLSACPTPKKTPAPSPAGH